MRINNNNNNTFLLYSAFYYILLVTITVGEQDYFFNETKPSYQFDEQAVFVCKH